MLKQRFSTDDYSESETARDPIFLAAENLNFGRFGIMFTVSTPCFLSFLGLLNKFFLDEVWFWGVRVGFGGREGALATTFERVSLL